MNKSNFLPVAVSSGLVKREPVKKQTFISKITEFIRALFASKPKNDSEYRLRISLNKHGFKFRFQTLPTLSEQSKDIEQAKLSN